MIYDTIIIGAGASGLMCAAQLPKNMHVLLIDGNDTIAKKIKISGGGKCNITNKFLSEENYVGDKEFIKQVFSQFDNTKLLQYLEAHGLKPVLRKGEFYFCKESAQEIIEIFKKLTKHRSFSLNNKVQSVSYNDGIFIIETVKGEYRSKQLVVASGGASFPSIGATSIALDIAKEFGLTCKPFKPALVGLTLQPDQFWMKKLSGISVDVTISVEDKTIKGSLLFAHKGISGPAVLNSSLYWTKGILEIDFLPNENVLSLLKKGGKKQISSILPLPKRFVKEFLDHLKLEDKSISKLTQEEREKLLLLHKYRFAPAGNFGFSKAEVSLGGVITDELETTFATKKVPSLYFIGEAVDVTGALGGYNFQWAFSSAVVCARAIGSSS